jgi:hypothetical protein
MKFHYIIILFVLLIGCQSSKPENERTHGRGTDTTDINNVNIHFPGFIRDQPFFSGSSNEISYKITDSSEVSIKIYSPPDMTNEIITLVDEKQDPGLHEITWGSMYQYPSGEYYIRLIAKSGRGMYYDSKKFLIVK